MAEELILHYNNSGKKIPIVIARPSIIGTAANEPLPGWTDSTGLLQGAALIVGLGILRDIPGNGSFMADIIPVDHVARQILVSVPYLMAKGEPLLITHCTSSSLNPTTWQNFFNDCIKFQNQNPYEKRAGVASLTIHKSRRSYETSYKLKNQLPTNAIYYYSRVFGSKT